ncbi:MAG: cupredoxin domain-containing protein [Chloroflexota bacterium]|nr:cupredoxin domain-containing protein [Chloroflexota bacterium]
MSPRIHARPRTARALVPALALLLAACAATGDGSPTSSAIASQAPAESTPAVATDQPTTPPTATATATTDVTEVTIAGFSFGPAEVNVKVGEVTFANSDEFPHTVTEGENGAASAGARFDEVVGVGKAIVITFAEAGDYHITCQFHAQMRLLVHAH